MTASKKLEALDVMCPVCHAPPGWPCVSSWGGGATHWRRLSKARRKNMLRVVK